MDQKVNEKGEGTRENGVSDTRTLLDSRAEVDADDLEVIPAEAIQAAEDFEDSREVYADDPELDELGGLAGTVIDGRYQVEEELARGGMGIVFTATHLSLNRPVVIKVLKSDQVGSTTAKARFEREARRACQLDHPNIVTVHDFGYFEDLGYLVMEYVDGYTLSDFLRKHGPLSFLQFAPVAAAVCRGLAEAHRHGIIHRDIKSSNIMLTFHGQRLSRVKILDFGLAKVEGSEEDDVTKKSNLIGTMGAMPPERILCKPMDCRVDLYALGVVAYRMITGRRPFVGDDMHVLYQHVHEHPPPLTEMLPADSAYPVVVLEWVHRLLAKDPEDRPKDAAEARQWLYETVADTSIFQIEEGEVDWLTPGIKFAASSSIEITSPSWSATRSSGSFRSLLAEEMSSDISWSDSVQADTTARHVKPVEPEAAGNKTFMVGAVASVLALVAIVSFGVVQLLGSETSETVEAESEGSTIPAEQNLSVESVFERVEENLERGSFGTAENLLNSVRPRLGSNTEYQVRAAEYQTRIDIDNKLRAARKAEDSMRIERALEYYDEVLSLEAGNAVAQERHEELSNQVFIKVTSMPSGGRVFVDGRDVGETPLEAIVPANFSTVEIRNSNYKTYSTTLIPDGGTRLELSAVLEPLPKKGTKSAGSRKTTKPRDKGEKEQRDEDKGSSLSDEGWMEMK